MQYPFSDLSFSVPVEKRNFESYYADRLYSMDTVVITVLQTLYKPDAEAELMSFLETISMAHQSAQDRMAEVEEYIRGLELALAATTPLPTDHPQRGLIDSTCSA